MFKNSKKTIIKVIFKLTQLFLLFFINIFLFTIQQNFLFACPEDASSSHNGIIKVKLKEQIKNDLVIDQRYNDVFWKEKILHYQINITEELQIKSLSQLKEKYLGFYFDNFFIKINFINKIENRIIYPISLEDYYFFHILSDKNELNNNISIYKCNIANPKNKAEITCDCNIFSQKGDLYLELIFYVEGFSEATEKIYTLIDLGQIITFNQTV